MGVEAPSVRNGASEAVAMDTEESDAVVSAVSSSGPRFSINVLQLIKTGQAQHGLRQGDYKRYRQYCTARLLRLYKSLKFLHGRGKYVKKPITETIVSDVRHLQMVVHLTERAWAYAMEIKQRPGKKNARQRYHLIRRLSKAAKWGDLFAQLCAVKADSRTSLEAEAYASYMRGNLLLEREDDWEKASMKFKNAKAVYDKLGKYGDIETQVLCRQRVEELNPIIRYCLYKLGNSEVQGSDILDPSMEENPALELLQSKLEVVLAEARSQQAVSMTELEWLGRKHPVNNQKTRVCILKGQELEKELTPTSLHVDKKLAIYDKIFIAYQDARRHIREDLVTAGNADDVKDQLNGLDRAVSSILLQRTIDRNLMLISGAKNRLNRQRQGLREERGEKPAKPEDVVRLCDLLIQNVTDLSDLITSGRDKRSEELQYSRELAVRLLSLQAERSFYLAQSYSLSSKYAEAYLLFNRAIENAESALHQLSANDTAQLKELKELVQRSRAEKCLVHAKGVTETTKLTEGLQNAVSTLTIEEQPTSKEDVQYLMDRLDTYESAVGRAGTKELPRIAQVPPPFQSVPCRPIVLDTSASAIDFPSLEARLKKEDKKGGFLSKWWQRS